MNDQQIPPIGDFPASDEREESSASKLEFSLLNQDAEARHRAGRESDQRYYLRWIALAVALTLMLCMALLLGHLSHKLFWGPFLAVPASFGIAAVVAPIASMTAVTIVFFVAAFRKFQDDDAGTVGGAATEAAKATGVIG